MINSIRNMINSKQEYLKEAEVIVEDVSGANLDDLIVLGESGTYNSFMESEEDENESEMDNETGVENEDEDNLENDESDDSEMSTEDNDGDVGGIEEPNTLPNNDEGNNGSFDIMDHSPATDTTVEPTEPIIDPLEDILNTQINLKSNTVTDTLPIPPSNAGDAIVDNDDIMNQRVDSGFGGDDNSTTPVENPAISTSEESDTTDLSLEESDQMRWKKVFEKANMLVSADGGKGYHLEDVPYILYCASCANKNKKPVSKNEFNTDSKFSSLKKDVYTKISSMIRNNKFSVVCESIEELYTNSELMSFTEAISIGDDNNQSDDNQSTEPPADLGDASGDTNDANSDSGADNTPEEGSAENDVTSAVRDKVEESEMDDGVSADDPKAILLKKLGNLTKSLEDTKSEILKRL